MFLLVVVAMTVLSSFTNGFPDRGIHGPNPKAIPESEPEPELGITTPHPEVTSTDSMTHSPDDVVGVGVSEASLPYCDEVEADKPIPHIDPPPLISEPDAKPDVKPDEKQDPNPDAKPDPNPDVKPDPNPDVKPDVKPDPNPDTKPEENPDAEPDPNPDTKPDPNPDAKPGRKPGVKPGRKPGAKPGRKPGAKPGRKPGAKPWPNKGKLKHPKRGKWRVKKQFAKPGKEWMKTQSRMRNRSKGGANEDTAANPMPAQIPCLSRDLSQKP